MALFGAYVQEASFAELDHSEYCTLSARGVTRYVQGANAEFTSAHTDRMELRYEK